MMKLVLTIVNKESFHSFIAPFSHHEIIYNHILRVSQIYNLSSIVRAKLV